MSKQLETFRDKLEVFAAEHKQDIRKDPAFRKHFQVGRVPKIVQGVPSARRPLWLTDLGVQPSCLAAYPLLPNSH